MSHQQVAIRSIAHSVPDKVISSEEVAERFVNAANQPIVTASALRRMTGISERRYAAPGECSSDLAASAGTQAIERAGLGPEDVDVVIFAAASHDVAEPATANRVQSLLGCARARVFDLKNACNSFLDALDVAGAMLGRDPSLRILIASGEVISPFIRWSAGDRGEVGGLVAGLTLGDAGAAAVITTEPQSAIAVVGASVFRSVGDHWAASRIMGGGSMHGQNLAEVHFVSDSARLFSLAIEHIPPLVKDVLAQQGWAPSEVDLVVPHQASEAITKRLCELTDIPFSRCMLTGSRLGNTAAASIPVALSIAYDEGRLMAGGRTLLVGGAAGFSGAAMTLTVPAPTSS